MSEPERDLHSEGQRVAPLELPNFRVARYQGDDLCLPMEQFSEEEQGRLRAIYALLLQLCEAALGEQSFAQVAELLQRWKTDELRRLASEVGQDRRSEPLSSEMAKILHDVRGGGLLPLVWQLQLARRRGLREGDVKPLFYLARDHLKIMRNALLGLDELRRIEDARPKPHSTDLLVEKWQGALLHEEGRGVRIEVECRQVATIGNCCLEFGALDRMLYNLLGNACRHAATEVVRLFILVIPEPEGSNLRFVVRNALSAEAARGLKARRLATLFEEGTSTTGSGYGLSIVADFVSHAYGLPSAADAVAKGYVGANVMEESFAAWFHWPRAW